MVTRGCTLDRMTYYVEIAPKTVIIDNAKYFGIWDWPWLTSIAHRE